MSLRTILVPYDGSAHADDLLRFALDAVREAGGRVVALYVTRIPSSLPLTPLPAHVDSVGNAALDHAEDVARRHGYTIETRLARAHDVADAIVGEAEDVLADTIIMPSVSGLHLWARWRRARLVRAVRRQASCPVLLASLPAGGQLDAAAAVAAAENAVTTAARAGGRQKTPRRLPGRRESAARQELGR